MKKIAIIFVLIFNGICIAPEYRFNMGVFQSDKPSPSLNYRWNIGADQTDKFIQESGGQHGGGISSGSISLTAIMLGDDF